MPQATLAAQAAWGMAHTFLVRMMQSPYVINITGCHYHLCNVKCALELYTAKEPWPTGFLCQATQPFPTQLSELSGTCALELGWERSYC